MPRDAPACTLVARPPNRLDEKYGSAWGQRIPSISPASRRRAVCCARSQPYSDAQSALSNRSRQRREGLQSEPKACAHRSTSPCICYIWSQCLDSTLSGSCFLSSPKWKASARHRATDFCILGACGDSDSSILYTEPRIVQHLGDHDR